MENSLKATIGAIRSRTGEKLNQAQVAQRLISRIEDLEETQFRMMGALQALGADCCDRCKLWKPKSQVVVAGDRCRCLGCFDSFDDFFDEGDDQATCNQMTEELLKYVQLHPGKIPRDPQNKMYTPWAEHYQRLTR